MEFWQATAFSETEQLTEVARIAEEVGFDGIAVSDHIFFPQDLRTPYPYTPDGSVYWTGDTHWPDPWIAIAAMAAVTQRIRFTTNAYVLPIRNVFTVAKTIGTAAVVSGGRVVLGAGAGWMEEEFEQLGQDYATRGKRFEEMVDVLRRLWSGGMVEYHGRFHDFPPLQMSPAPAEPIPIWIAGQSKVALRRAATIGDGWLGLFCSVDETLELLERLRLLRKEAGRDDEHFDAMVAITEAPTPEVLHRLEDAGLTVLVTSAWMMRGGDSATVEAKRAALEWFAEQYIQPYRR